MGRASQGMWVFAASQAFLVVILLSLAPALAAFSVLTFAGAVASALGLRDAPGAPLPHLATLGLVAISVARIAVPAYSGVVAWERYVLVQVAAAIAFAWAAWVALRNDDPSALRTPMLAAAWTYLAATVIRTFWYDPWQVDVALAVATVGLFVCASGLTLPSRTASATPASEPAR